MVTSSKISTIDRLVQKLDRAKLIENYHGTKLKIAIFDGYCDAMERFGISRPEYVAHAQEYMESALRQLYKEVPGIVDAKNGASIRLKPQFFYQYAEEYGAKYYGRKEK